LQEEGERAARGKKPSKLKFLRSRKNITGGRSEATSRRNA
jgi:hypothetical protein